MTQTISERNLVEKIQSQPGLGKAQIVVLDSDESVFGFYSHTLLAANADDLLDIMHRTSKPVVIVTGPKHWQRMFEQADGLTDQFELAFRWQPGFCSANLSVYRQMVTF